MDNRIHRNYLRLYSYCNSSSTGSTQHHDEETYGALVAAAAAAPASDTSAVSRQCGSHRTGSAYHTPANMRQHQVSDFFPAVLSPPLNTTPLQVCGITKFLQASVFTAMIFHTDCLITTPAASARWSYHTPWVITRPLWTLRAARYHPGHIENTPPHRIPHPAIIWNRR